MKSALSLAVILAFFVGTPGVARAQSSADCQTTPRSIGVAVGRSLSPYSSPLASAVHRVPAGRTLRAGARCPASAHFAIVSGSIDRCTSARCVRGVLAVPRLVDELKTVPVEVGDVGGVRTLAA
jgi:hypothetical protein